MRIIGGKFRGRRFEPPADKWPTRPTMDQAKEALFNILNNVLDFEDSNMLDLFGGTGSHSYEFISRGCEDVTYVDKLPEAVRFVRQTAQKLGIEGQIKIFQMDVFRFIENTTGQWDYIFVGPPYDMPTLDTLPDLILGKNLLKPDGLMVLEHNPHNDFVNHPNLSDVRNYGKSIFSFFKPDPTADISSE
jgi:16S rRNA (guanine966-N2)-methyltransferase